MSCGVAWLALWLLGCSREPERREAAGEVAARATASAQLAGSQGVSATPEPEDGQWTRPGKDFAGTRYSQLAEISRENVRTPASDGHLLDRNRQRTRGRAARGGLDDVHRDALPEHPVRGQMYAATGGHRGEFLAWDLVNRRPAWSIKEDLPVWSGALVTAGDVAFYGTMHRPRVRQRDA